jgi:pyruvate,water dikinase
VELDSLPPIPVKIMMNVGNPDRAFDFASIPHRGVGLARLEFIINRMIGVHPRALLEFERQSAELKEQIRVQMAGYADPVGFYVAKLAEGISQIAAAFAPEPVIVRLSDFKIERVRKPHRRPPVRAVGRESDARLPRRGALRRRDLPPCFELECRALRHVRERMGLTNVWVMVPFVRTVKRGRARSPSCSRQGPGAWPGGPEAHHDVRAADQRPARGPVPAVLRRHVDRLERHDPAHTRRRPGLGHRRRLFDERDDAVKALLSMAITACRRAGKYIGICGQGPSRTTPISREWLAGEGITSISLNPDTVQDTWILLAQ